jgi:uncharacterized RDD family membrane protein YckC
MENENDIVKSVEEPSSVIPPIVNASNLASKNCRFLHLFVDIILIRILGYGVVYLIYSMGYGSILETERINGYLLGALIVFLYYFIFEGFFQMTPAKFITKSIVVNRDGSKPSFGTILMRSVVRLIPFEAITFLGKDSTGFHDSISKTCVIYKV